MNTYDAVAVNQIEAMADTFYDHICKMERQNVETRGVTYALCLVASAIVYADKSLDMIAQTMLNANYPGSFPPP